MFKLDKENQTFYDQTLNVCNFLKANTFSRLMISEIVRAADFEVKCPFKAGFYHFKSREHPEKNEWLKLAPSWIKPEGKCKLAMTFKSRQRNEFEVISYIEYFFYPEKFFV